MTRVGSTQLNKRLDSLMKKLLSTLALTIFLTIASFLVFNRSRVAVGLVNCNITATGAVQSDGSVSGSPNLGDVYQIQGTVTANYVDDDEVNTSTIVVTAPDGSESIAIQSVGNLALTFDHRAIDGAYAARYLRRMGEVLATRDWAAELR